MIRENVSGSLFPTTMYIDLHSYQNILFHPQQILSDTDTWQPLPLRHTESVDHIPRDCSHRHLQRARTPSDHFHTTEVTMALMFWVLQNIPVCPFPSSRTGYSPNRNTADLEVISILKGSQAIYSHLHALNKSLAPKNCLVFKQPCMNLFTIFKSI